MENSLMLLGKGLGFIILCILFAYIFILVCLIVFELLSNAYGFVRYLCRNLRDTFAGTYRGLVVLVLDNHNLVVTNKNLYKLKANDSVIIYYKNDKGIEILTSYGTVVGHYLSNKKFIEVEPKRKIKLDNKILYVRVTR